MTVQVKICGLTNLADALCAVDAGADLLGFIFAPKSPRYVSTVEALTLADGLRAALARPPGLVGVFVDAFPDDVEDIMQIVGLDYAQLHGTEPVSAMRAMAGRAFKALRPRTDNASELVDQAQAYAELGVEHGPRLLVDAYSPHAHGGTGQLADWTIAASVANRVPGFVLAGGLTPENVAAAIRAVRPWGVDTSSGVESTPGRKDHDAVRRFVAAAKSVP